MKTLKVICVLLAIMINTNIFAQRNYQRTTVVQKQQPKWSLTPLGGVSFPLGVMADNSKPGANAGLDIAYRINKEVGIYTSFGYYFTNSRTTGEPTRNFIEYSAGTRYFFTKSNLKSSLFLEAGVGGYSFQQNNSSEASRSADTRPGVNTGIGANLSLSKSMDIVIKGKYNLLFTPDGSNSFITTVAGLQFKF